MRSTSWLSLLHIWDLIKSDPQATWHINIRRGESEKLYGGVHCWYGQCGGLDEISHVSRCEGYNARPVEVDDGDPRNLVNYLIQLNSERIRKWGQPLLFTRGFWTTVRLSKVKVKYWRNSSLNFIWSQVEEIIKRLDDIQDCRHYILWLLHIIL